MTTLKNVIILGLQCSQMFFLLDWCRTALHWLGPWPLGHGHNQMELLSGARGATPPEKKCQPPYISFKKTSCCYFFCLCLHLIITLSMAFFHSIMLLSVFSKNMSSLLFGRYFKHGNGQDHDDECKTPTNHSPSSSKYSTPVAGPSPGLSRRASFAIGGNLLNEQCTSRAAMILSLDANVEFRVNEKRNRDGGKAVSTKEQERKRQRSCDADHVSETASNSSGLQVSTGVQMACNR